jgi:hypothetical protein
MPVYKNAKDHKIIFDKIVLWSRLRDYATEYNKCSAVVF